MKIDRESLKEFSQFLDRKTQEWWSNVDDLEKIAVRLDGEYSFSAYQGMWLLLNYDRLWDEFFNQS